MPPVNRIAEFSAEMKTWRRWLHQHPELGFELPKTAGFVADRLREMGVDELHEGIATSGMVAIINGQGDGPTIGLRADMDALPITESTGAAYASVHPGRMHACGHDGHTTMLLGAAKYLAETRRFRGRVALIFQPAEEGGGGADVMCRAGLMERFDIAQVFGVHNVPDMDLGQFQTRAGRLLAAVDDFEITVTGRGGHAAMPHETIDPIPAALALAQALQTIVTRNVSAQDELVISVTQIHTGSANNVVPESAWINGTVRSFDPDIQALVMHRMQQIMAGLGQAYNVEIALDYHQGYPATINDADRAAFAADVASEISGPVVEATPSMGAEDFSYMLQRRPGAYVYLGIGGGASLHHPEYDFNDDVSHIGASFFARLVERAQPV